MSIDERFLIAIAIMASVAFGFRVAGLLVGTYLGDSPKLHRILDILPTCAIGAVLGPSLGSMTLVQVLALAVAAAVFWLSSRFLFALIIGTAILLSDQWVVFPGL